MATLKRILITGSSGYLGQHVLQALCKSGKDKFEITAAFGSLASFRADVVSSGVLPCHKNVNLVSVDLASVDSTVSFLGENGPFDVVIHLAAVSSLYQCETDQEKSAAVNVDGGPHALLRYLSNQEKDCTFIFSSTDQVYDGLHAPYTEGDATEPVNFYGQTKLRLEELLLKQHKTCNSGGDDDNTKSVNHKFRPIILRSSLILGGETPLGACRKQTFLQWAHSCLEDKKSVDIYTDEFRNVVYVDDVVKVISFFVEQHGDDEDLTGVYNMGGKDRVNRYDVVLEIAKHCGLDASHANPAEKAKLPKGKVDSPPDISMDISKLESTTGIKMRGMEEMVRLSFPVGDTC